MAVIDVWMQHPTLRHSNHEMFDSLKRWMGLPERLDDPIPLEITIAAMDEVAVARWTRIVCGHIGYPWTTEMIAVADKHPNVFIDTNAYAAHRYPAELVEYLAGRGQHKVLFGTNYPMLTATQALARLDELNLDADVRADFLGGNARRVFQLD